MALSELVETRAATKRVIHTDGMTNPNLNIAAMAAARFIGRFDDRATHQSLRTLIYGLGALRLPFEIELEDRTTYDKHDGQLGRSHWAMSL
jgi:hypothetical protein